LLIERSADEPPPVFIIPAKAIDVAAVNVTPFILFLLIFIAVVTAPLFQMG